MSGKLKSAPNQRSKWGGLQLPRLDCLKSLSPPPTLSTSLGGSSWPDPAVLWLLQKSLSGLDLALVVWQPQIMIVEWRCSLPVQLAIKYFSLVDLPSSLIFRIPQNAKLCAPCAAPGLGVRGGAVWGAVWGAVVQYREPLQHQRTHLMRILWILISSNEGRQSGAAQLQEQAQPPVALITTTGSLSLSPGANMGQDFMLVKIYKIYVSTCNHLTNPIEKISIQQLSNRCIWVNNENDQTLHIK